MDSSLNSPATGPAGQSVPLWDRFARLLRVRGAAAPRPPHTSPGAQRAADRLVQGCFQGSEFDVAAAERTRLVMQRYRAADAGDRHELIAAMVRAVHALGQAAVGVPSSDGAVPAAASARACELFFKRVHAQPDGLAFLVGLRSNLLDDPLQIDGAAVFKAELRRLLGAWFDVGLLDLRRLTWDSPASVLQRLIDHEAVHAITSWDDLRHRLEGDHQCYALMHPSLVHEPLIFVEVALREELADDVGAVLDQSGAPCDLRDARWANFYSISNAQDGLRGISFGNYLLKRVMAELAHRYPQLTGFATLSPMPGFRGWLEALSATEIAGLLGSSRAARIASDGKELASTIDESVRKGCGAAALREATLRLAAHYLTARTARGAPIDPVARFHLANGARIERLNWAADASERGLDTALGVMVNYRYVREELDANSARLKRAQPRLSRAVARLI